ncbi:MAG: glycosyltransferase family 39 protein [Patescibacteria group bacterium]|nr:glycosyltransferase family 39 protein [Patescibacteria group bacterium]
MTKLQNYAPKIILAFIIISSFLMMIGAAKQDSAIMDELAHIPAGYSYVKYFDYRLNPEHPPLVKALAAMPLLFQNLNFPINSDAWQNQVNSQWEIGTKFLYESGNNADNIIFYSRLFPILLTLILIGFAYFWASELMGRWWALLPTALIGFSPNFLAHGHYVTTDVGASLGFLVGTYFFLKYVYSPTQKNIIFAGVAFGFAELLKFSTVLLAPLFIGIVLIIFLEKTIKEIKSPVTDKFKRVFKYFYQDFGRLLLIFIVGGSVIYVVYFIFTFNYPIQKQYSDTASILQGFGKRWLADPVIAMSGSAILRPIAQYLLGVLMVMQRSSGGNTAYFLGQVSNLGNKLYFPMVFLMKETLPALIIIFFGTLYALYRIIKRSINRIDSLKNAFAEYLITNFSEFTMLLFVLGYWGYSLTSTLNIGFRHIMPTLPFIYILASQSIKKWFASMPKFIAEGPAEKFLNSINKLRSLFIKILLLMILLFWLITSAFSTYPYFLSKFNEIFGGKSGGYKYVTDSNFDWGQDLKRLKKWVNDPPNGEIIDKIAVDYFGGGDPKYYLGDKEVTWKSSYGNPMENGIKWLAVSINTIQSAVEKTIPGLNRDPQDEYLWLNKPLSPDYVVGTSIFIYKLDK